MAPRGRPLLRRASSMPSMAISSQADRHRQTFCHLLGRGLASSGLTNFRDRWWVRPNRTGEDLLDPAGIAVVVFSTGDRPRPRDSSDGDSRSRAGHAIARQGMSKTPNRARRVGFAPPSRTDLLESTSSARA